MAFLSPQQIAEATAEAGQKKVSFSQPTLWILGFLGGAFINLGFLLDIRVIASMPAEWGSFTDFIGAAVFPLGLILILLGGGELLTGNMMVLPLAWFAGKIPFHAIMKNWVIILISNFIGSLFIAYFFGHVVGLTETGPYLDATVSAARSKVDESFMVAFISAIGCNWLVGLAVWLSYGAKDFTGKILAIWFPIMAFVAIGFQHLIANMFIIPAAIFAGGVTWLEYLPNFIAVFLGNIVGGAIFVALAYFISYREDMEK